VTTEPKQFAITSSLVGRGEKTNMGVLFLKWQNRDDSAKKSGDTSPALHTERQEQSKKKKETRAYRGCASS